MFAFFQNLSTLAIAGGGSLGVIGCLGLWVSKMSNQWGMMLVDWVPWLTNAAIFGNIVAILGVIGLTV